MLQQNTTERNYKAFISYRHRPLDMAVAKKLHKRIERYVIPKELRKDGAKKLGLVFRDQDELPIANNLTENIRIALDHAEYLIVVCTPDTPHSEWVNREITYFLEHHSRDNVLAVLADGEPEQSFPKPLTEVRNEAGELLETIEPLAANIVAPSESRRNRLFKTESLRILASLIGCPYDALYRREQRYKMRRMGMIGASAAVVAAAFIGLLINRNARIQQQLTTTQINESKTLAALSKTALRDGDFRGALEDALNALPGRDPSRPYVPEAEKALSNCLKPYKRGYQSMSYLQSVTQDTEIRVISASNDGAYFATADSYGQIRLYDLNSCTEIWKASYDAGYTKLTDSLYFIENVGVLAYNDYAKSALYSLEDGSVLWETENGKPKMYAFNETNGLLFSIHSDGWGEPLKARLIDGKTGKTIHETQLPEEYYSNIANGAISRDGRYAAAFLQVSGESGVKLTVFDFETGNICLSDSIVYHSAAHYGLRFTDENELVLACCGSEKFVGDGTGWEGCYVSLYDPNRNWAKRFRTFLDFGTERRANSGIIDTDSRVDYFECGKSMIALSSRNRLVALEIENGAIRWQNDLSSYITAAKMIGGDSIMLVLHNGMITMCFDSDGTYSSDAMLGYFEAGYDLIYAAISPTEKPRTSRYLLVSAGQPYRASLVGLHDSAFLQLVENSDTVSDSACLFLLPDRSAAMEITVENNILHYDRFDPSAAEPVRSGDVPLPENGSFSPYFYENHNLLTSDGKLILRGLVVDFAQNRAQYLALDPSAAPKRLEKNLSCIDPADLSVLTASLDEDQEGAVHLLLWRDGLRIKDILMPFEKSDVYGNSDYEVIAVGANGYVAAKHQKEYQGAWDFAVYSMQEDRFIDVPPFDPDSEEETALAAKHPWMALQQSNGELILYDLSSGAKIRKFECDLLAESVKKMEFFSGDERLAVFSGKGDLRIYRTSDGAELHRSNYVDLNLRFNGTANYRIEELPQQNRLLIFFEDLTYREPACIVLELSSYENVSVVLSPAAWLPNENRLLIRGYPSGLYLSPLLTTEELLALGEEVLEKGYS